MSRAPSGSTRIGLLVGVNQRQADDVKRLLAHAPAAIPKAISAAVNDTGRWVHGKTRRGVSEEVNLSLAGTRRFFVLGLGSPAAPRASVRITGSRMRLTELGARQTKRGASYRIRRAGGRKIVAIGFIAKAKRDIREHVWKRVGRSRYPIQPLFGPSIPQVVIDSPDLQTLIRVDASERLALNLARQVDRFLKLREPAEEERSDA